jgi:lysophospholipase L1-like esterase
MATPSQVKAGLDEIAELIRGQRAVMEKVKSNAAGASAELAAIPTEYADVIATIDAYAANSTDYFERLAKAEKAKMAAEFTALKADADAVVAIEL